jgi:hypothetical protein
VSSCRTFTQPEIEIFPGAINKRFNFLMKIKQKLTATVDVGHRAGNNKEFEFKPKLKLMGYVLHNIFPKYSEDQYKVMLDAWKSYVVDAVRHEGVLNGAKKYKAVRSYTLALVEGRNPEAIPWLATGRKDLIPSRLNAVRPLIKDAQSLEGDDKYKAYQALNTLLYISRSLEFHSTGSYGSITKTFVIDDALKDKFRAYVRKRLSNVKLRDLKFVQPMTHGSKGPNGKPRVDSAFVEALALVQSPLWGPFKSLCAQTGMTPMSEYLTALNNAQGNNIPKGVKLRKLATVTDSDLKMRIVAIPDFWTQSLLEVLTPRIKGILQTVFGANSGYWDHNKGFQVANSHPRQSQLKSYDFTDWTDLLHHDLQKIVMEEVFGLEIADAWFNLVVKCQWYSNEIKKHLVYGMGQGMGTTNSFLIASVTDHFYLEMTLEDHNDRPVVPDDYTKTGDDLVVEDPDGIIPEAYSRIGSVINQAKSKVSTERGSYVEYVSRVSFNGHDVSRVSPKVVNKCQDWRYIPVLLCVAGLVGIELPSDGLFTLNQLRKSDNRSYRSLLADLLTTLKWTEKDESFQSYIKMNWDDIGKLGYFKEATLDANSETDCRNFRVARALVTLQQGNSDLRKSLNTVYGIEGIEMDHKDIIINDDYNLWDMNSPLHEILEKLPDTIKYKTGDGKIVLGPKTLIAALMLRSDYKLVDAYSEVIMEAFQGENLEEDLISFARTFDEMRPSGIFKDFKTFKETKALERAVSKNLRLFQRYDYKTQTLSLDEPDFLQGFGIDINMLGLNIIETVKKT